MTRLFSASPTLATDAWHAAAAKHPVGSDVRGVIHGISHYGAFVDISEGVDGLIHASDPGLVLLGVPNIGDEVTVRINSIDPARRWVGLRLVSR